MLPRTRASGRTRSRFDEIDEIDDFETEGRRGLGQRTKLALLIGAVAAVVVIGLAIGYAVLGIGAQPGTVPSTSSSVDPNSPPPTTPARRPANRPAVLLTDTSMLSPDAGSGKLDADRTWKVELTQRGASEDAPVAACFGGDAVEGQPVPQQKILQVLSSSGQRATERAARGHGVQHAGGSGAGLRRRVPHPRRLRHPGFLHRRRSGDQRPG